MTAPLLNVRILPGPTAPFARLPHRQTPHSAGLDLFASQSLILEPGVPRAVSTGIAIQLPLAHVGLIAGRSGLAMKGLAVLGGVIDADYTGEVKVCLINHSRETHTVNRGDRVAQLLVMPITVVCPVEGIDSHRESLSQRGAKGFGSSGA